MRKTFLALISNRKLFTFHCMASCGYSLLVGGPCGPSSFNPANAECVAIGECSKDVYNHLVYCKISDDIAVDSESNLLLTRAGRWFSFRHFKYSKMIFYLDIFKTYRHSYLRHFWHKTVPFKNNSVPTTPRFVGIRWRCNKARCSISTSAGIDAHRGKSSATKAQYGFKKAHSAYVMSGTNILVPVGSRKYLTLLLFSGSICINDFRSW